MGATYTRQSSSAIVDGGVIEASDINAEFNQILAAFAVTSGHTHDGTAAEGGPITKLLGTAITIGDATAGTDIAVTFDGESNDGVVTWMEDEDYFQFSDDLLLTTTEKLQFRDTAIYINSSADGQLDLVADTEIQIAATTIDINGAVALNGAITGATNITLSGELDAATLDISGDADIDGTLETDALSINSTAVTSTAAELNIVDGGTSATSTTVADADRVVLNDNGTMVQVAVTDLAAYFDDEITAMPNLTSVGTLTTLTVDNVIINGSTIGHTGDTDLMTVASGVLTVAGEVDATSLDISGDADIDGTLEADAITVNGTALASSATTDTTNASNIASGTLAAARMAAAQTAITSILATDIKIGEDNETKIDFETANEIHIYAANAEQVYVADGIFGPQTDSDVDLGSTSVRWKDAFVDSLTTTGAITVGGDLTVNGTTTTVATTNMVVADNLIELNNGASSNSNDSGIVIERGSTGDNAIFAWDESADTFVLGTTTATGSSTGNLTITDGALQAGSLDISGNIDVDGTTNLDVVDIDGAVDMASTLQVDGAITSSAGATITVADNSTALELISTDADASVGPRLSLYRNSASPADNDILGDIRFMGEDDASAKLEYAKIEAQALDVSSGSIDTQLRFQIRHAGSGNDILKLTPTEVAFNDGSFDTDFRVESNNQANAFKIDAGNDTASFAVPVDIDSGITIDNITIDGTEIDLSSGDLTIDVAGDITLDAGGSDIRFDAGGSEYGKLNLSGNNLNIHSSINDADIVFKGEDGGSTITALTLDMSAAGAATFNDKIIATELDISGNVDVDGTLETDALSIASTTVTATAAEINLIDGGTARGTTAVADGDGILHNDGGTMRMTSAATFKTYFQDGLSSSSAADDITAGDAAVNITTSSGNITIDAAANDTDIIFKGTDGGADITMLTLDGSDAGTAIFNHDIKLSDNSIAIFGASSDLQIFHDSSNSYISEVGTGALILDTNGTDVRINKGTTENMAKFNTDGAVELYYDNVKKFETSTDGVIVVGHVEPSATDTYDLGQSDKVWRNIYTGDLHLSNEAKSEGNAVDGTKGSWTIQEGSDDLFIVNNKSGKKYKFKLEEI